MKKVFQLDAINKKVVVYSNHIKLIPSTLATNLGEKETIVSLIGIKNVINKAGGKWSNGYVVFQGYNDIPDEKISILKFPNVRGFFYGEKYNDLVIEIIKFIQTKLANPSMIEPYLPPDTINQIDNNREAFNSSEKAPRPSKKNYYRVYENLTKNGDWEGVFKFNNLSIDNFATKKELTVLSSYLADNEVVFSLASGLVKQGDTSNSSDLSFNSWLVALTNQRILFLDHALLTKSVDTQSIRLDKVQAVSASQGFVFGKITIDIGNRSITIDNCPKSHVKVFADIANDWLSHLQAENSIAPAASIDIADKLSQLWSLHQSGALSDKEYNDAKSILLSK